MLRTIIPLCLLALFTIGCDLEPVEPQPSRSSQTPAEQAWREASVSGRGQAVKDIRLVTGTLVCRAEVSGNNHRGGAGGEAHFSAKIVGDYSDLIANDIASSGAWEKTVRVGSSGRYLVEVNAEAQAQWKVSCRRP